MKNANTKSRASSVSKLRARLLTSWAAVSVLAASLLFIGLLTGCQQNGSSSGGGNTSSKPANSAIFKTDGKGTIIGCTCEKNKLPPNLVIPDKIGDEVIKKIGWRAFADCEGLKSIDFSACTKLNEIKVGAFDGCTGLKQLILPESLTTIGMEAFRHCPIETLCINSDIESYYPPGDKTAWLNEDSIRENLKTLKLGRGITTILYPAFKGCTGLTSVDFSNCKKLTRIDGFSNCTGLTSITLPENLTEIGSYAFQGCIGLTSVDFSNCKKLTQIDGFPNCTGLTSITLPENLTHIGYRAFQGCTGLTSITLPENLIEIGYRAFEGCIGLTSITLPEKLTKIDDRAFKDCTGLNGTIVFPANIETIYGDINYSDSGAFRNCINLQGLDFSACKNLTFMPAYAFYGCKALSEVKLPENIDVIGINTFEDCIALQNITLPANLTSIKANAFKGCTNLTSVVFKNTQNWKVYNNYNCTSLHKYINQGYLQDAADAAKFLREDDNNGGYSNKHWKRN